MCFGKTSCHPSFGSPYLRRYWAEKCKISYPPSSPTSHNKRARTAFGWTETFTRADGGAAMKIKNYFLL
jgi:hypothetical protein